VKLNIITENFVGYFGGRGVKSKLFGGAEIILNDLCELLQRKGHRVTVIQLGTKHEEFEFNHTLVRQVKAPSFRLLAKVGLTRRFHGGGFFWKNHLDSNVDRVHFHYYYLAFPYGTDSMTGFSHGVDWDCPWQSRGFTYRSIRDRFSSMLMKKITLSALKKLKRIIANDRHFERYVKSVAPEQSQKIVVVPNAVDTKRFSPAVPGSVEVLERCDGKIRILLPKMPAYERGTDIAIRAIASLPRRDVALLVVGESSSRHLFEKMARDYQVQDRVYFLGHRDHFEEMPAIYTASDIVIVPSPCREATSLAVLEGMASGKPVIASDIGGIPDIITDPDVGMLIRPLPADLNSALQYLLAHDEIRSHMGCLAREWATHHFSKEFWETRMAEALDL
jgi:glycosyltransferase involved in cell wall biosynthesis